MGPIKSWITDPNVNLAFNAARGITATGAALTTKTPQYSNPYDGSEAAFNQLMQMQEGIDNQSADLQNAQADLAMQEASRDAEVKAREATSFQGEQALRYSASGVLLEGSPMLVLEQTRKLAQQEIDAIGARGAATADLLRRQAAVGKAQGKASLLGEQAKFKINQAQADLMAAQGATNPFLESMSGLSGLFAGNSAASVPRSTSGGKKRNPAVAGKSAAQGAGSMVSGMSNFNWKP